MVIAFGTQDNDIQCTSFSEVLCEILLKNSILSSMCSSSKYYPLNTKFLKNNQ